LSFLKRSDNHCITNTDARNIVNKPKLSLAVFQLIIDSFDGAIYVLIKHFFYKKVRFLLNIPREYGIIQTAIEMADI